MPKKKYNVILDLDNTLICAQHSKSKREPDFEIKVGNEHYYVYKRPGLDRFLNEIFDCSKSVSIWTAATKDYCNQIVKNIFTRDERKRLKVVWSRGKTENKNGFFYVKDVSKMCASQPTFLHRNTVLIDDNPDHAVVSPDNLLRIRPWNSPSQRKDTELRKVLKVLT